MQHSRDPSRYEAGMARDRKKRLTRHRPTVFEYRHESVLEATYSTVPSTNKKKKYMIGQRHVNRELCCAFYARTKQTVAALSHHAMLMHPTEMDHPTHREVVGRDRGGHGLGEHPHNVSPLLQITPAAPPPERQTRAHGLGVTWVTRVADGTDGTGWVELTVSAVPVRWCDEKAGETKGRERQKPGSQSQPFTTVDSTDVWMYLVVRPG